MRTGCLAAAIAACVALWAVAPSAGTVRSATCETPTHLGVVFVLDDSGSMASEDPSDLRGVAAGIGLDALSDGSLAAGVKFTSSASALFGPTELQGDVRAQLKSAIVSQLSSSGGTEYEPAFVSAAAQLAAMPAMVDRKAVVFLSDGQPNSPYSADQQIAAQGIPIFTVAFGDVDRADMAAIAARSGGQAYAVASPGEAQAAFARIVSRLTCDSPQVSEQVDLAPGETASFPFTITPTDREFRALAAWESGDVDVRLVRPRDLGVLDAQSQLAGETFDAGDTFVQARAIDPAAGGWELRVTASPQNLAQVGVSIDVFKRLTTDPPDAPRLTSPQDGATLAAADTTVTFSAARGARTYDVIVDGAVVTEVSEPASSAQVTLAPGGHELYVQARNEYGATPSNRVRVTVPGASGPAPPPVTDLQLLQQYMPRLFLDDKEDYAPIDAESFLLASGTRLCDDSSPTDCVPPQPLRTRLGMLSRLSDLAFANTNGSWLSFDQNDNRGTPRIFGHVIPASLQVPYRFLDYWWFFPNNDNPYGGMWDHRGDWEGAYVAVGPRDGAGFAWVGFDGHGHATRYLPEVLRCAAPGATSVHDVHERECGVDAARVNVYAANGSHASYPRRCDRNWVDVVGGMLDALVGIGGGNETCAQTQNADGAVLPEGDFNGRQAFSGNEQPQTTMKVMPSAEGTWPRWRGRWGDPKGGAQSAGPLSPGQQQRFRTPLSVTGCTDRWAGANNHYTCPAARLHAATADTADIDECDAWFGAAIAVGVCDAATIRSAIAAGTVGDSRPGIEAPDAANANGVAQLAGMLTPASPAVRVEAASGLVYARALSGRQVVEALYDARPGGLVIKVRRDALARPLLRVRDRNGRLVAPRMTNSLHFRPLSRPRVRVVSRVARVATLRVRGASSVRVTGAGVRATVRRVRAERVRLAVARSTRNLRVSAVGRGRVSSRPVMVTLPAQRRTP
jgi:Mg-chelatase subunit ChlD